METWDEWQSAAIAADVSAELVQLGREVMRDYQQHGHSAEDPDRRLLGGNGEYLQQLALTAPTQAFLDFNATLILGGASARDGDVEGALASEAANVAALKQRYGHT